VPSVSIGVGPNKFKLKANPLIQTQSISPQTALPLAAAPRRLWNPRSIAILILAWLILQIGGLFTPGLLDDVDSVYIQIAREMLQRHDYVIPTINGIRFFDKPPLIYWMAAASMHLFGIHDWAARLPLALCVLALLLAVYALGIRLFNAVSPAASPDRAGFYAALALATSVGPYLYTRFYIPDILLALWMTLGVHLILIAVDRVAPDRLQEPQSRLSHPHRTLLATKANRGGAPLSSIQPRNQPRNQAGNSALLPCLAFAAVMAANVLTKGLIGLVFPIGFVLLYLALTRQLRLLLKLHLLSSTAVFLALAAPWHVLAALRAPAIALPSGMGLPTTGGWAWFYLYNEHIARFLSKRIPHDYGQTPVWLFCLLLVIWIMPWAIFLPRAIADHIRVLREKTEPQNQVPHTRTFGRVFSTFSEHEAALSLVLWTVLVVGFFCISARQEYYSLPAIPALALIAGGFLARADNANEIETRSSALSSHLYLLLPLATLIAAICAWFAVTTPHAAPGTDIATLIAANPEFYNLSLGHLFDLTGAAMGLFRGPLAVTALSMLFLGLGSYLLRHRGHTYAANLTLAAAMTLTLLAAHEGLARFYPILGSKDLALAINDAQRITPRPNDLILLDGELTSGSTLIFYTGQQVHLLNGRVNGLWYGSFWPDAPRIFETESTLHQLWASPRRIFLFTYNPTARTQDLTPYGLVHTVASAGGKTILSNR
jgi:4-amino-4-deoxy-L-arabinose transferase-like glycosyltransferase